MADPTQVGDPTIQIRRMYLKDASLEQPNSPAILLQTEPPSISIQIAVEAQALDKDIYEVGVRATVHTQLDDKTVFLVEALQAGIFELSGLLEQDQVDVVLGIACPQIVYPYLRSNVADLVQRAGFPPVHMAEINFQSMYERQMETTPAFHQTTH